MICEQTSLDGVLVITPDVFKDNRGWFFESYSRKKLEPFGLFCDFVQDNHSKSEKIYTLRGLHFQLKPKAQAKLVRCVRGKILDVAVDLRRSSKSYLKWTSVELSEENKKQIFIPAGFAHGFLTLVENTEVVYKTDEYYSPEHDFSVRWNDPQISVDWGEITPELSKKDASAPFLAECEDKLF